MQTGVPIRPIVFLITLNHSKMCTSENNNHTNEYIREIFSHLKLDSENAAFHSKIWVSF